LHLFVTLNPAIAVKRKKIREKRKKATGKEEGGILLYSF